MIGWAPPLIATAPTVAALVEARLACYAPMNRAFELVDSAPGDQEFDDPKFQNAHPWVAEMVAGLRFMRTLSFQTYLDDHLNVFVSIPDDIDDPLYGGPAALIASTADAIRRLEDRQQQIVSEARRRGITWTAIGEALGTTRQSAWARYSGED